MTGPKENSKFSFPETTNVSRGEAVGNTEVEGKQTSLFLAGPVIIMPANSKLGKKNYEEVVCYTPGGSQICRAFKEHDLNTCESAESSCCCFPRELVSFDPRRVTRFPPIGKRI